MTLSLYYIHESKHCKATPAKAGVLCNKSINEKKKEGAFTGYQREVISIYIRARERESHFNPPLFPALLILQKLASCFGTVLTPNCGVGNEMTKKA